MKTPSLLLAAIATLALALPPADAQYRGGRRDAPARRGGDRGDGLPREFEARLWYGAGGTLQFSSFNGNSFAAVGLSPQIGYKINPWLSAGPRFGLTWNTIKGNTDLQNRQRVNTWDWSAGGFARAKVFAFYAQAELSYLSNEFAVSDGFGTLLTDPIDGQPRTVRDPDTQLLLGVGYNPGGGLLGTDIGVFYNLFDDVQSNTSPIVFRVMVTFNY